MIPPIILQIAEVVGSVIGIYILTVFILLALIRLKKDENDNLIIDHNSWHFKMAYPVRSGDPDFVDFLKYHGINICPYFAKLVYMFYIGWPMITLLTVFFRAMSLIIFFPFGKRLNADVCNDEFWLEPINFPKIRGFRILPIYVMTGLTCVWLVLKFPTTAWHDTVIILALCITLTIVIITVRLIMKGILYLINNTDVGLLETYIKDKKNKLCRRLKVV